MNGTRLILAAGMILAATPFASAQMGGGGGSDSGDAGAGLSSNGGVGPNGKYGGGRYPQQGPYSYDAGYYRGPDGRYQVGPTDAPYPQQPAPRRRRQGRAD